MREMIPLSSPIENIEGELIRVVRELCVGSGSGVDVQKRVYRRGGLTKHDGVGTVLGRESGMFVLI